MAATKTEILGLTMCPVGHEGERGHLLNCDKRTKLLGCYKDETALYVSQTIMRYTLHSAECQLYLNKKRKKKNETGVPYQGHRCKALPQKQDISRTD